MAISLRTLTLNATNWRTVIPKKGKVSGKSKIPPLILALPQGSVISFALRVGSTYACRVHRWSFTWLHLERVSDWLDRERVSLSSVQVNHTDWTWVGQASGQCQSVWTTHILRGQSVWSSVPGQWHFNTLGISHNLMLLDVRFPSGSLYPEAQHCYKALYFTTLPSCCLHTLPDPVCLPQYSDISIKSSVAVACRSTC